ncbi:MAG: sigma-54 dependent transcriptional regulator [Nitrospira sp.]|nr:sigma-54 dependent transcriptional regulator [Nitrospira sp.]MCW5796145.1 sigma-54-dependent Fis family transcriptional regulator [Nitrospira sp.]HMV58817.1 sigma-54 dependent transcriptional regulator [Nitrospira sp.]HMW88178.1 sigma-54 dependent transcriptional regulator [Nitrospira sp.]HMZ96803.1 sigma-54 dependent transcriptional regulator [Nitrospira sp.]
MRDPRLDPEADYDLPTADKPDSRVARPSKVLSASDPQAMVQSIRASCLVFEDSASQALLQRVRRIAPTETTALIIGETGTGKKLIARHVHELSTRRTGPFIAVNCAAITESLMESELFGHERGAFTGASSTKAGWFETAQGGSLFLDEIGDLPLALQAKLLRVIQQREVVRVGARRPLPVDVRLIAATNVKLEEAVAAGRFRADLYYRLHVVTLQLPPLRERRDDILPLATHFLSLYGSRLGFTQARLSPEATDQLLQYPWPGNIRELENTIHHALVVCPGTEIRVSDLRLPSGQYDVHVTKPAAETALTGLEQALQSLFQADHPALHRRIEETVFRTAYDFCDRNQVRTAQLLGISRNIVRDRLIRYGLLPSLARQ